jgi:hypothetical protein
LLRQYTIDIVRAHCIRSPKRLAFQPGGKDAIIDPWGQHFQFEIRTDEKGDLSVDDWTTAPDGTRLDYARKK